MPIYRQDIMLCATAYVRADSPEAALLLVKQHFDNTSGELPIGEGVDVAVSDRTFDDPRLQDVTLAPAVTFYGAAEGSTVEEVE